MEDTLRNFQKRQLGIRRKHQRMARGYVNKLNRNGVILQKPLRKSGNVVLRIALLCLIGFVGFKTLLIAGLGPDGYLDHVATLNSGSGFERASVWIMRPDPATARLAEFLAPYLS